MSAALALDVVRLGAFHDELACTGARRIDLPDVWRAFARAFPRRPELDERVWLAEALQKLESEAVLRQPASRRSWEELLGVALPRWVVLTPETSAAPGRGWRAFPWHPRLGWVADLIRLDAREEAFLRRVHEALVAGTFERQAPAKHRSLALLGQEKALEELLGGRLFRAGRLSLELLGCMSDVPPLAWANVGPAPTLIVFENQGAFAQARAALMAVPNLACGLVGFGDGNRFERSVAYIATLGRPVTRLLYVGDLDAAGLAIAGRAAQAAASHGLPALDPAPGFHAAMLAAASQLGHPHGWPASAGRSIASTAASFMTWLPEDVRDRVAEMLRAGHRIPEEVLSPDEMARAVAALGGL